MEKFITFAVVAHPDVREGLIEFAGKQRLPGCSSSSVARAAG